MKLPFFQPSDVSEGTAESVEPPWQTLVLICENCKGSRRGPDARTIRKGIKQLLGKQKQLRAIEVDCLGVCPDDAVTVCTVRRASGHTETCLVRTHGELETLARRVDPRSG